MGDTKSVTQNIIDASQALQNYVSEAIELIGKCLENDEALDMFEALNRINSQAGILCSYAISSTDVSRETSIKMNQETLRYVIALLGMVHRGLCREDVDALVQARSALGSDYPYISEALNRMWKDV